MNKFFEVSIGNHGRMMKILVIYSLIIFTFIIGFAVAISTKIILFDEAGKLIFPVFLGIGIFIFIDVVKRQFNTEFIQLDEDSIITQRFGRIQFADIVRYKVVKVRSLENLKLTLVNGQKIVIADKLGLSTNVPDYFEFKADFMLKMENH